MGQFEEDIKKFEESDKIRFPEKGGILFVGSSTFTMWKTLEKDMCPLKVINRGFGGSTAKDVLEYMDRIVIPYAPGIIVFYEGDNDIGGGTSPEEFLKDCRDFVKKVWNEFPDVKIVFVSIKPSIVRSALWEKIKLVNAALKKFAEENNRLNYIDVSEEMLEAGLENILLEDKLHMNEKGYAIWANIIKRYLMKEMKQ